VRSLQLAFCQFQSYYSSMVDTFDIFCIHFVAHFLLIECNSMQVCFGSLQAVQPTYPKMSCICPTCVNRVTNLVGLKTHPLQQKLLFHRLITVPNNHSNCNFILLSKLTASIQHILFFSCGEKWDRIMEAEADIASGCNFPARKENRFIKKKKKRKREIRSMV